MKSFRVLTLIAVALIAVTVAAYQAPGYHITSTYALGGDGSWDYLTFDSKGNRVFIGRENRIMVVDAATGKLLGEVPGLNRAHGVALSNVDNRGFATSGGDGTVTIFDLKTYKVLDKIIAADDADAIFFDPAS